MGELYQFSDAVAVREFEEAVGAMDLERVMQLWAENPQLQDKMLRLVETGNIREFKPKPPPSVA